MKIYIAAPDSHGLNITNRILLSYYDICVSKIVFRKKTWKIIKESYDAESHTTESLATGQARVSKQGND